MKTRALTIWLFTTAAALHAVTSPAWAEGPVRPAYCAGSWYPQDADVLAKQVADLLAAAPRPKAAGPGEPRTSVRPDRPLAIIVPHAGYRYSAPVAAAAYRALQGHDFKRVIVLAFSHRNAGGYEGIDVPAELTAYQTPLGQVPIDRQACDALLSNSVYSSHPGVDEDEHSLELQLPFLRGAVGEFQLVPLLVGRATHETHVQAARALLPLLDDTTLLVASSDFTHYGPNYGYQPFTQDVPAKIKEWADRAAAPLERCDSDGFLEHLALTRDTICGRGPISLLLRTVSMMGGADGVRAAYDTSGNVTGEWTNSVTYQSFVFYRRPGTLGQAERTFLLELARRTVTSYLEKGEAPGVEVNILPQAVQADGGCFVTLENHGRLRGCIGNMQARGPLYQAVIQNAVSACRDQRFVNDPVTAGELKDIDLEISYLTPMKRVGDPRRDVVVGRHGLLISLQGRQGVLLPQVAYERGWTREEFLSQTCHKAGLPPDAWKRPEAEIYSFEAEVFGER